MTFSLVSSDLKPKRSLFLISKNPNPTPFSSGNPKLHRRSEVLDVFSDPKKCHLSAIELSSLRDRAVISPKSSCHPRPTALKVSCAKQFEKVLSYIDHGKREGATLLAGGKPYSEKGFYIEPTIFTDVKDDMLIAKAEIFGSVMSIMKFKTIYEAID